MDIGQLSGLHPMIPSLGCHSKLETNSKRIFMKYDRRKGIVQKKMRLGGRDEHKGWKEEKRFTMLSERMWNIFKMEISLSLNLNTSSSF